MQLLQGVDLGFSVTHVLSTRVSYRFEPPFVRGVAFPLSFQYLKGMLLNTGPSVYFYVSASRMWSRVLGSRAGMLFLSPIPDVLLFLFEHLGQSFERLCNGIQSTVGLFA